MNFRTMGPPVGSEITMPRNTCQCARPFALYGAAKASPAIFEKLSLGLASTLVSIEGLTEAHGTQGVLAASFKTTIGSLLQESVAAGERTKFQPRTASIVA